MSELKLGRPEDYNACRVTSFRVGEQHGRMISLEHAIIGPVVIWVGFGAATVADVKIPGNETANLTAVVAMSQKDATLFDAVLKGPSQISRVLNFLFTAQRNNRMVATPSHRPRSACGTERFRAISPGGVSGRGSPMVSPGPVSEGAGW